MELHYNGASLSDDVITALVREAKTLNVPVSYLITKLHYEGLWGHSKVAKADNNLTGMTWTGESNRPSGVTVTKGSARPQHEGGHYMRYASLDDFFKDWLYLIRRGGSYKVADSFSFSEAVKGMFRVGGAKYDYATMNVDSSQKRFELYLKGMQARRDAINQANHGALDELDKKGVFSVSTTATQVLNEAKKMIGVTQRSASHKALVNEFNSISQNLQRNGGGHYNATYGDDWCDIFVSVMFKRAGGLELIGAEAGVQHHKNYMKSIGIWKGVVKPQAGDIIIYDWNGRGAGWADHIGIVESFDGTYVKTIEGNVGSPPRSVGRKKYRYNDRFVEGYARPRFGTGSASAIVANQVSGKANKTVSAEVAAGVWGNNPDRKRKLEDKGYNYDKIQEGVNLLFSWKGKPVDFLADKVLEGYFGTGVVREKALTAIGATYTQVQKRVTEKVKGRQLVKAPLEDKAKEVFDGKYGNNPERSKKLADEGYSSEEIQKIQELVNKIVKERDSKATTEVLVKSETQTGNAGADLADNEVILNGVRYKIVEVK